jgi:hypothetical protein
MPQEADDAPFEVDHIIARKHLEEGVFPPGR